MCSHTVGGFEQIDRYHLEVFAHTREQDSNVQYHYGYFIDGEPDERFLTDPQISSTAEGG